MRSGTASSFFRILNMFNAWIRYLSKTFTAPPNLGSQFYSQFLSRVLMLNWCNDINVCEPPPLGILYTISKRVEASSSQHTPNGLNANTQKRGKANRVVSELCTITLPCFGRVVSESNANNRSMPTHETLRVNAQRVNSTHEPNASQPKKSYPKPHHDTDSQPCSIPFSSKFNPLIQITTMLAQILPPKHAFRPVSVLTVDGEPRDWVAAPGMFAPEEARREDRVRDLAPAGGTSAVAEGGGAEPSALAVAYLETVRIWGG